MGNSVVIHCSFNFLFLRIKGTGKYIPKSAVDFESGPKPVEAGTGLPLVLIFLTFLYRHLELKSSKYCAKNFNKKTLVTL